ncbi:uncharacterized protein LOC118266240 isoform X2 [Spodoptera frugiperda]|uniref:Uncharacterized protein LOC118266240 isoform X2 n=1 Tax=Spodoptera frugiperda TaxID=7108 RepID=A0A9R0DNJ9_SPOFR|nr:uncharacterized protein LOC118266240 isoform X2 [Spodoptera frugiperda]
MQSHVVLLTPTVILYKMSVPNVEKEKKAFQDVLPEFIDSVVTTTKIKELPEVATWLKQVLNYVLPGGKLSRGLITSVGYKMFEEPEYFSESTQHDAHILGWCIQMMHAVFFVLDDIADGGTMRHNKTCWHLQRSVGVYAVNDALMIQQAMMDMLKIHFGKLPIYNDLISYFNEAMYRATMGEHLDLSSNYNKHTDNIEIFNMGRLHDTAVNKTGCYSFKLPVFAALLLVKNGRQLATTELNELCYGIGRLMQVQDDYLDVYGTETITGKNGRDIQEGKCTWFSVTALQRCNSAQLSIFKEYYGSNDLEHVQRIKQLYDELNLRHVYEQYELKMYDDLLHQINELPHEGGRKLLTGILNSCFKRVK